MTPAPLAVILLLDHTGRDVVRALELSAFMFLDTFWAIVMGFAISGAVQSFVAPVEMQRRLGDHRPGSLARAATYGVVSSSCSYAASAMARSLFQKGADFTTSVAFMVASTNLVVELGIVLVVLIGWPFVAAEFLGGVVMIALLGIAGTAVFSGAALAAATRHVGVTTDSHVGAPVPGGLARFRSGAAWSDAALATMGDLRMLRREILLGYTLAGLLAALVPARVWQNVFLAGHGPLTVVENALVGPLIALASCVCSIGNVPLAAALWHGGISFAGVVSFLFADLISFPLLLAYRRLFGRAMARRMLIVLWPAMSASGLVVQSLFGLLHAIPTSRRTDIVAERLRWDSTTVLDLVFSLVLVGLWTLARQRDRFAARSAKVRDPVCGMLVDRAAAVDRATYHGRELAFCSPGCRDRFLGDPGRYLSEAPQGTGRRPGDGGPAGDVDPICGMTVTRVDSPTRLHAGTTYRFCSESCADAFDRDPDRFARAARTDGSTTHEGSGPTRSHREHWNSQ